VSDALRLRQHIFSGSFRSGRMVSRDAEVIISISPALAAEPWLLVRSAYSRIAVVYPVACTGT